MGDLKLVDFKQFLANTGLQVEFAGVLYGAASIPWCARLAIDSNQKGSTGSQQIVIGGPLCED